MKYLATLTLLLLATACTSLTDESIPNGYTLNINDKAFEGKAIVSKLSTSPGYKILLIDRANETLDQTIFKYPVYQFDTADVDRDGRTDILVGVIKSTEFDPGEKKRLFILRIDEGHLRPLWLGSKVCQELVDFKTLNSGRIQTLEKTSKGNYAIGIYAWQGFGLTLIHYLHNEISFHEASQLFTG